MKEGPRSDETEIALKAICSKMVEVRAWRFQQRRSRWQPERDGINELRSRGILETPNRSRGTRRGDVDLRFTHHLLHDYAIAATLIPTTRGRFTYFAIRQSLLPVFYRQSFIFALEELWDADDDQSRRSFWESAFELENFPTLHGTTRILAPILAARRIEVSADLEPLLNALRRLPMRRA